MGSCRHDLESSTLFIQQLFTEHPLFFPGSQTSHEVYSGQVNRQNLQSNGGNKHQTFKCTIANCAKWQEKNDRMGEGRDRLPYLGGGKKNPWLRI